jgi:hypothetical protein
MEVDKTNLTEKEREILSGPGFFGERTIHYEVGRARVELDGNASWMPYRVVNSGKDFVEIELMDPATGEMLQRKILFEGDVMKMPIQTLGFCEVFRRVQTDQHASDSGGAGDALIKSGNVEMPADHLFELLMLAGLIRIQRGGHPGPATPRDNGRLPPGHPRGFAVLLNRSHHQRSERFVLRREVSYRPVGQPCCHHKPSESAAVSQPMGDERAATLKHRLRVAEDLGGSAPRGVAMEPSADRRRNSRIRTRFETSYSSGREDGLGLLANISYSGALLTQTSLQPRIGSQVRVFIFLSEQAPFVIIGQVVRHVEDGFAIEYADLSPELRRLIDDAAAMVGDPARVAPARNA